MLKELELAKDLKKGQGKLDVTFLLKYQCPICKHPYDSSTEATKCFWNTETPEFKPGEVVTIPHFQFGWFDGDPEWIATLNPEGERPTKQDQVGYTVWAMESAKGCNFSNPVGVVMATFYWVVEAVHGKENYPHNVVYTVSTGAMKHGRRGWTGNNHYKLQKVDQASVPNSVLLDAKSRADRGIRSNNLLG